MAEVVTFGCRINSYESEVIKEKLHDFDGEIIIVNTCAVTSEAERQCRQTIRRLRREHPQAKIIATGCSAQVNAARFAGMKEVDLVLGNREKQDILHYLSSEAANNEKTIVGDIFDYDNCDPYIITGFEGRHRAFVQIQQGCNHRCTYCIVPYARGRNRCVPEEKIILQIKKLLNEGFLEICLSGIDACSYQPSFTGLVQNILTEIKQDFQLQFGSLDPAAVDDELIALIGQDHRITPQFHLSVQSGDNLILKRMKRRHSREDVIKLCKKIRAIRPETIFGADFICGFPTETEQMFQNTLHLIKEAGLNKLHVFPYSERKGTPAAAMPQIPVAIRKERAARLRQEGEKNELAE